MNEAPKRACILKLELHGDTRSDILRALNDIYDGVHDGRTDCVSGGCSYGYSMTYAEGERPTHDEYFEQLRAWRTEGKTESP